MSTFLTISALITLGIGGLAACGGASQQDIVNDAAGCGHFVFPPSRSIVLATTDADWHGDGRIELVADIPTRDLDSFVQQSKLPPLTPGAPEGWIESILKDHQEKELADVLRAGKPEDFQQNYQSIRESPSGRDRGVIAQQLHNDKTRIYIDLNCF